MCIHTPFWECIIKDSLFIHLVIFTYVTGYCCNIILIRFRYVGSRYPSFLLKFFLLEYSVTKRSLFWSRTSHMSYFWCLTLNPYSLTINFQDFKKILEYTIVDRRHPKSETLTTGSVTININSGTPFQYSIGNILKQIFFILDPCKGKGGQDDFGSHLFSVV